MEHSLQLQDYADGYGFQVLCRACNHEMRISWFEIDQNPATHKYMRLQEVEKLLSCRHCKKLEIKLTVYIRHAQHHFIAGQP